MVWAPPRKARKRRGEKRGGIVQKSARCDFWQKKGVALKKRIFKRTEAYNCWEGGTTQWALEKREKGRYELSRREASNGGHLFPLLSWERKDSRKTQKRNDLSSPEGKGGKRRGGGDGKRKKKKTKTGAGGLDTEQPTCCSRAFQN